MSDKIQLLPDSIANQIAAGEVIQRPASVAKELLENALDSGATHIKMLVKQAGKTLVQVIDNGCGMSTTDARMCFEKHATSKIRSADDLFNIRTMGFRGEALSSIAAIAQVEMRTRQLEETLGTLIEIAGMKVQKQEPCNTALGTSIAVKNLFFNVPARRAFLKSDPVELKNIIEEFLRVALAHPKISFQFFNNDHELFHFKASSLKQRICSAFDDRYAAQIVPVEQETYALKVTGFVGKPEYAKKTRGEQYIYVNGRFIKSAYLNHAVATAFDVMLPKESFPFYVLFIDIDPARIDINVHPQKYEVKFDDEKMVYTFMNLAVKHALGAYSVSPSIDFNKEDHLERGNAFHALPHWMKAEPQKLPTYDSVSKGFPSFPKRESHAPQNLQHWQQAYTAPIQQQNLTQPNDVLANEKDTPTPQESTAPYQLHKQFIISQIKSGFILIDQQAAHERILFERYVQLLAHNKACSQRQLFPQTIQLSSEDAALMSEVITDINALGFDIQPFGKNSFVVHALPADIPPGNEKKIVEELLEQYKQNQQIAKLNKRENIARSLAQSSCIKRGQNLTTDEMYSLIDELFACEMPYAAPNGRLVFTTFTHDELAKRFAG